jgi:hypothetical protein
VLESNRLPRGKNRPIIETFRGRVGVSHGLSDARIVIHFNVHQPIELVDLTLSFQAIARRYRKFLVEQARSIGQRHSDADVKLFVTKIESNCILAELGGATEILGSLFTILDYVNIFIEFAKNTKNAIDFYHNVATMGEIKPSDVHEGKRDIEAIADFLKVAAQSPSGELGLAVVKYHSTENNESKEVLFEVKIGSDDAAEARRGALLAQKALEYRGDADYKNVLMYLFQTNTEESKTEGVTAEKAVIRSISEKALPLYFASELDNDRMQTFKHDPIHNPFKASFRVDVNVETDRHDTPRFYRVMRLHEVIPGDPD